ncbi:hypothetical protein H6M51_23320 [Rhizobium sp. AQ_MP]|uniref:hypothetical protein n=1 Tax=Rhizobium sp. AQ_MP TaxID=2761536 RepID=UPI001639FF27|nr:hypothetical protein [Rhizobium sp. AQ_MP]MBC2775799.1 hypothetical protein [Rhizobium sp. AQ_MP]
MFKAGDPESIFDGPAETTKIRPDRIDIVDTVGGGYKSGAVFLSQSQDARVSAALLKIQGEIQEPLVHIEMHDRSAPITMNRHSSIIMDGSIIMGSDRSGNAADG